MLLGIDAGGLRLDIDVMRTVVAWVILRHYKNYPNAIQHASFISVYVRILDALLFPALSYGKGAWPSL